MDLRPRTNYGVPWPAPLLVHESGVSSEIRLSLGHFQVGSYRYSSLIEGPYTLQEPPRALYTLNSTPVVAFNL